MAGDPFLYLSDDGKSSLFLSDLEVDRAKQQSQVDEVVRTAELKEAFENSGATLSEDATQRTAQLIGVVAKERGLSGFEVPASFPVSLADALRGNGLGVTWVSGPFVPERVVKTPDEIASIRRAIEHTEAAITAAIEQLRAADVRDGVLHENGAPLTAEAVRFTINRELLDRGCVGYDSIVAGGEHAVDPHDRGSGPLDTDRPIILDVFPRDLASRFHGDMTRTVVKGQASDEVQRMFDAVKAAKDGAEAALCDGVDGWDVHAGVVKTFEDAGFVTEKRDGRMVGFFHGTGHGLGLDVHEAPRLGKAHDIMRAGHVVTVEPGLYYPGVGGMRLEDDVVITKDGCENLCTLGYELEI